MKTKCIVVSASLVLAAFTQARADTLYSESFDSDPGYVGAKGPNDNNISSVSFGAAGSGAPNVAAGQYGGTSQYLSGTTVLGSTSSGKFAVGSDARVYDKSRSRSYLTCIDTSSAAIGQYNVSFDVSDFQSADTNTALYFHLYEGGGTDKGYVNFQVTSQAMLPAMAPSLPGIKTGKGATTGRVLVNNEIEGNGKFSLNFGLSEAGTTGDYLALVWTQVKRDGSAPLPSMTIDNVHVSMLPEPAHSEQSLPAPSPYGQTGSWRLLSDVSDEFNSAQVNPRKWNSNPGSWAVWSWDEANAYQESGKLYLRMVYEPHILDQKQLFYKSGIVRSHKQLTYGYYEARIKGCSVFPGACPAFWVYSDGKKYSGETRYCEIDFVELQMNDMNHETNQRTVVNHIDMNLHLRLADKAGDVKWVRPQQDPDMCAHAWQAPWDPRDDFHVYGCDVTEKTIIWFIDGKEVAREENKYWHLPMNVTLSLGLRYPHVGWVGNDTRTIPSAATAEGFPTAMEVDYVRVWEKE